MMYPVISNPCNNEMYYNGTALCWKVKCLWSITLILIAYSLKILYSSIADS